MKTSWGWPTDGKAEGSLSLSEGARYWSLVGAGSYMRWVGAIYSSQAGVPGCCGLTPNV